MRSTPVRADANNSGLAITSTPTSPPAGLGRPAGTWFLHELDEILPPTIFFVVGFNRVVLTTNLIAQIRFDE
jgi:hypothetical protein